MKRPEFLETKRTPRYSLRKLNVGVASVLLGVTIFGINFTDHSVKAATTESVATGEVQRSSGSNTATANNPTKAATTPQSSPETQGSADTDIRSLTAISAAKLATMNLMQTNGINGTDTDGNAAGTPGTVTGADRNAAGTPGTDTGTYKDRSAAVTVNPDNINTQPAKENQKLANEHNLTSSDNYSSNIYKGTDGKYYKIITIYGNDYVYRAADIQASGANWRNYPKQTAEDTKNNISISKEDLGNGQTRWTVVFFPNKGLQNYHSTLNGLSNAKFGIALTSDYQIVGNVDMDVISDPKQSFVSHTFKDNSNRATDIPVQNPSPEVKFSFNPKTDVDPNTGLINSETMPAYNNQYLQGPYYFTTATSAGTNNLWQTYFKDADERKNAYDGTTPYLGGNHDFHFNTFKIANETGVDGAKYNDPLIYDTRGGVNGVFSSDNFNQAMEFKSQGYTGNGQSQFSSYVISFTTQHTDSHEVELTTGSTGSKNQQFSGISANIYSFQNDYTSKMSSLYGEQRALDPAGALVEAKKIIPHWGDVKPYMDKINQDYLNNAQINVLRNKILNNITDPGALNNIVNEGNSLNDAMKNLGNSIGQYDSDGKFTDHKEDTTKSSDRYKYANPDKKEAYDNATEVTKALINKDTGTYADQATVKKLTTAENDAWSALDGKKPTDAESDKVTAKDGVSVDKGAKVDPGSLVNVTDPAGKQVQLPAGSVDWKEGAKPDLSTSGDKTGKVEVTLPDGSKTEVPVHLHVNSDAESDKVTAKDGVSVDKGAKVDPGSLVNVTDPAGKQVQLPAGSVDWKEGAKPDLSTSGDKTGKVEVTLPDGSKTEVPVHLHVNSDAESDKVTAKDGVSVDKGAKVDPGSLVNVTDPAGKQVQLPAGSVDWKEGAKPDLSTSGDKTGKVEVTLPDGSKTEVPVHLHVNSDAESDKVTAKDGVSVDKGAKVDPGSLVNVTDPAGKQVQLPAGSVDWKEGAKPDLSTSGDKTGKVEVTLPDGSKTEVPVHLHVNTDKDDTTDAGNITPTVPGDKVTVKDPSHLTDDEKNQVKNNVDNANKDKFPAGTDVTVGDDGTATVNYPDGSKDTIPGDQLVQGQKGDTTDAGNITPTVPGGKVTVKDPSHLTDDEKKQVKNNVDNANKDKFPAGTDVTVGDDGTATVNYPDGSKDTIPGDQLVQGQKGDTTDAGNITPTIPGGKVTVKDPSHLTDDEKNQVKDNVDNANKDKFPAGTEVTVGDDGTATIKYPDGSKDTIPGDQLVQGQKGDTTDAGNITPTIPGGKVTVKDPSHLTDDEKDQVKTNVTNANKDNLPSGSQVTVGNDGTTTTTYPDGSKDTIPGSDLVRQSTDADKITPKVPETKVPVTNPSQLTDSEKDQVKTNVTNANKDTLPSGSQVTVGNDGTTTTTYPDGSKDTIPGSDLVRQSTDADKTTPSVPGTKVPVTDPSHLTDSERDQVKTNVTNANKDNLPSGSQITVGDDGTATITYPDGSKDTIPGRDLIKGISGNKHDSNSSSGSNGTISNTDDETSGDTVNNAESMNGNTAKSGSKNNSLKTLPQTGTKDVTILEILGLFLSLFGLLGLKKKHHEE
ncbi:LEA family epithelial adhesin [Limosilactobacillus reuteri]|uniref:LEA family epithelial adhesin n=1 Tax=Limosilactobacillus reuteri TaxID=1598 RepID=UPI003990AEB6